MNITIKALKFGASSTISIDNEKLIIDCGSGNSTIVSGKRVSAADFAANSIKKELEYQKNGGKINLLISHFDNDHINGILKIPDNKIFNSIILPYSFVKTNNIAVLPYAVSRLIALAPPRSYGFRLSKNIIDLFIKLNKLSDNIQMVTKGDEICLSNKKLNILWPEVVDEKSSFDKKDFTYNTDEKLSLNKEYFTYNTYDTAMLDKEIEEITTRHAEFFQEINSFEGLLNEHLLVILRNETADKDLGENSEELENYYKSLKEESCKILKTNYEKLAKKRKQYVRNGQLNLKKLTIISQKIYSNLIKTMNACSIVVEIPKIFAYFGDVPPQIVEHLHLTLSDTYKVIKAPHHGTKNYYCKKLPTAENVIISNGGYKVRSVGEKTIDQYKNSKIICTNAHEQPNRFCDYNLSCGHCHSNCQKVHDEFIIKI